MDYFDSLWGYLTKFPQLLNQYSAYSYPLLAVLLAAGAALLGTHFFRKRRGQDGLSFMVVLFSGALVFLSISGFFLKSVGSAMDKKQRENFVAEHRAPEGEHWLLVFDFALPTEVDTEAYQRHLTRMENLVAAMSEILLEDLPPEFRQPRVIRAATENSPWSDGIGQNNFDQIIDELNAFEIMWGHVHAAGAHAKVFLGISRQLAHDLDTIIPLRDFALEEDPRIEHQFGEGYYRLLGLVALGMALDTYHQAQNAGGEERKALFLQATQQFNKAREAVTNRRDDPILSRNLYSTKVDELIAHALSEAGLGP